ncbi:MAG TPA: hypothetical protein VFC58_11270 [Desulfosporosinus sp.]|nr:hypothetical protein [Desulfosporosinus sp.]
MGNAHDISQDSFHHRWVPRNGLPPAIISVFVYICIMANGLSNHAGSEARNGAEGSLLSQRNTQPFYSRKTFIRTVIGAGLTILGALLSLSGEEVHIGYWGERGYEQDAHFAVRLPDGEV